MWNYKGAVWDFGDPEFASDDLDPQRVGGPWSGHRFFAYDLLANGRPQRVVELGSHYGVSFFAFCQAALDHDLNVELHAVDTWAGDEHAGFYDESVWNTFQSIRERAYPDVNVHVHRCLFDDAVADFEDGSIDLLHIDGFHSYEAAKHDHETWIEKLAPDAIVLFHDVDPASEYGSAGYWDEVKVKYPSITFLHNFGLGVLFPNGAEVHEPLLREREDLLVRYYQARAGAALGRWQARDLTAMIDARDEVIVKQTAMIDDRDAAIVSQTAMIDERDAVMRAYESRIADLDTAVSAQAALIDERDEVLREQAAWIAAQGSASPPPSDLAPVDAPPPSFRVRVRRRLGREGRRQLEIARAAAPHLPRPVVRIGAAAKRRAARSAALRRVLGLPPAPARAEPVAGIGAVFDAEFFRTTYGDPGPGSLALRYYLRDGWWRGTDPSPMFSVEWYRARYGDRIGDDTEPLGHYLSEGWRSGFDPSPWFSTSHYLGAYPDVAATGQNPLEHYWTRGYLEGRTVTDEHRDALAGRKGTLGDRRVSIEAARLLTPDGRDEPVELDLLVSADVDLVTFDLWDTLIARDRPADAAKVATARRAALQLGASAPDVWTLYRSRVETEAAIAAASDHEEYELVEVLEAWLERHGLAHDVAAPIAAMLADAEIEDELATTYPIESTAALFRAITARPDAPAVRVLSDFYIGADALSRLLRHHGIDVAAEHVSVSCDVKRSKRLGTAYEHLRTSLSISDGARHFHIGDNADVDGRLAVESGANAVLVSPSATRFPGPGALDQAWFRTFIEELRGDLRTVAGAAEAQPGMELAEKRALGAGVVTASLPVALVQAAIEEAVRLGLDRVHYLSREGAFLASVHRLVAPILAGPNAPRAIHLEASRRSTFGATLRDLSNEELRRMWSQYPAQSPRALLVSIGADPEAYRSDLSAAGLDLETVIDDIANDQRVQQFLERPSVRERLLAGAAEQRELLARYLEAREFTGSDAVLVDIGWRGTVQDNLCAILPDTRIHGVYLGLFPYLNAQPVNGTKRGVVFDANRGDRFEHVNPPAAIEGPWTPVMPSVIGYEADADGAVRAVLEPELGRADTLVDRFIEGTRRAAPIVAEAFARVGASTGLLRAALADELERYYLEPEPGVADIWFSSSHDDTFGAMNDTPFAKLAPTHAMTYGDVAAEDRPEAEASLWPAGYAAWLPVQSLELIRRRREQAE